MSILQKNFVALGFILLLAAPLIFPGIHPALPEDTTE
jgi:hypothetical protein